MKCIIGDGNTKTIERTQIRVENAGDLPVTTDWDVSVRSADGHTYEAQILARETIEPGSAGTVECVSQVEVLSWVLVIGGVQIAVLL